MAQTDRMFRELLCEGRAQPTDANDPTTARTIDELKKQVSKLKVELEGAKLWARQEERDHEKEVRVLREEHERRLELSLEAVNNRKDLERTADLKKLEERLLRQRDQEVKLLMKDRNDDMRKLVRRMEREREDTIRLAIENERRRAFEQMQLMLPEEEFAAREVKMAKEVFLLGEQNERLEDQVRNLSKENRVQIDLLRRMKQEYEVEIGSLVKQHQSEAARDMAQLQLAERIIAIKDSDLHAVEYRADMVLQEKEVLTEELVHLKSVKAISSDHEGSPISSRRSVSGPGGLLQRRLEDLEYMVKRLEEERSELKHDNASLRKKMSQESESASGNKQTDEKMKRLRKRNADLVSLAKQLDEKCKALMMENEKMAMSGGETEQQVRKSLSRQHARDIMDYTKQIHSKDREIETLRRKVAKFESSSPSLVPKPVPSPELEKKLRAMALEKLRMEKLIAKLYEKLPDQSEVENFSRGELEAETRQLAEENKALREQLESSSKREEVDYQSTGGRQGSTEQRTEALKRENEDLVAENSRLSTRVEQLVKFESECATLQSSLDELQTTSSGAERKILQVTEQLEQAKMAIQELEHVQDHCFDLERDIVEVRGQLNEKDTEICRLELECQNATSSLAEKDQDLQLFKKRVSDLESIVHEREQQCVELQCSLEELQLKATPPERSDIGVQIDLEPIRTEPNIRQGTSQASSEKKVDSAATVTTSAVGKKLSRERVKSPVHRDIARLRLSSPRASTGELDQCLEYEMKAAGVEITDSYDSSEGVGFSDDANLDDTLHEQDSILSMESDKIGSERHDRQPSIDEEPMRLSVESKEEGETWMEESQETLKESHQEAAIAEELGKEAPIHQQAEPHETVKQQEEGEKPTPPLKDSPGDQLPSVVEGEGGPCKVSLEELGTEDTSESDVCSTDSSESDLPALRKKGSTSGHKPKEVVPPAGEEGQPPKVAIFIAKYSYIPAEMSPNPCYEQELPITAGDYLYVYGDIDEDGFYNGQLMTGENGLVPSNFIERVMDENDEFSPQLSRKSLVRQRLSNLQDIVEEDEDIANGDVIPPPQKVELDRQLVEGSGYSVVIKWEPPAPLPPSATGYNVYVNGDFRANMEGAYQKNVFLSDIPRQQLVKISVRTVTKEGESPDPNMVVLNPHYPESPSNVRVSQSSTTRAVLVEWTPSHPIEEGLPITGYAIYINNQKCIQLATNDTPSQFVCAQLLDSDLKHLKFLHQQSVSLTVRATADHYESTNSNVVPLSKDLLDYVLQSDVRLEDSMSSSLVSSSDEEREIYSPAMRAMKLSGHVAKDGGHVAKDDGHVAKDGGHVAKDGGHVAKDGGHVAKDGGHVTNGGDVVAPLRYYRALYSYDPYYHSPNDEGAEEELPFQDGDIIIGRGDMDEDGFFKGELGGRVGLVPGNMAEQITDEEELSQIQTVIEAQREKGPPTVNGQTSPILEGVIARRMKAIYDYDAAKDSPNENSVEELSFSEGDIVIVYGKQGSDGFYQGELNGKRGVVPCTFLRELADTPTPEREIFAASEDDMRTAEAIFQNASDSLRKSESPSRESPSRKQKNILSRGKDLLSKSLGKQHDSK